MGFETFQQRVARIVTPYAAERLQRERVEWAAKQASGSDHGFWAWLARALKADTGSDVTSQHLSQIAVGNNAIGVDKAEALARYWGFAGIEELLVAAGKWQKDREEAVPANRELAEAVAFLRSDLPPDFLDGWLTAHNDVGWGKMKRTDFVKMILKDFETPRKSMTSDLENARDAAVKKPQQKAKRGR